jgi:hypothetical protein
VARIIQLPQEHNIIRNRITINISCRDQNAMSKQIVFASLLCLCSQVYTSLPFGTGRRHVRGVDMWDSNNLKDEELKKMLSSDCLHFHQYRNRYSICAE